MWSASFLQLSEKPVSLTTEQPLNEGDEAHRDADAAGLVTLTPKLSPSPAAKPPSPSASQGPIIDDH